MTRQEAKELIIKLSIMCDYTDTYGDAIDTEPYDKAVDMAIRSLETVRGKWAEEVIDGVLYTHCSECGSAPLLNIWNKQEELSRYCPNCGAEMRGENDDN